MELKQVIEKFTYRIEPKPEGGFVAHASDPSAPPLEAPTRLELQKKIRESIAARIATEFPNLKFPAGNQAPSFSLHIEKSPGGGLAIHSGDPGTQPVEAGSHQEIESKFAEKIIGLVGKLAFPELEQALAAQGKSADIKVFVNGNSGFTVQAQSMLPGSAATADAGQPVPIQSEYVLSTAKAGTISQNAPVGPGTTLSSAPIEPESTSNWRAFALMALIAAIAILYFFLHYR